MSVRRLRSWRKFFLLDTPVVRPERERMDSFIRKVHWKVDKMTSAIVLKGVTKTFGRTRAVEQLDLVVPGDALYGFIGPNGAGKTTSIRMIMSILFPDSGEISILGYRSAMEAKD